jgi:hypothetical protein
MIRKNKRTVILLAIAVLQESDRIALVNTKLLKFLMGQTSSREPERW